MPKVFSWNGFRFHFGSGDGSGDSLLNPPVPVTVGSVPVTLLNEIMKLAPDTLLLMRVGANPLIVRKLRYYADLPPFNFLGA